MDLSDLIYGDDNGRLRPPPPAVQGTVAGYDEDEGLFVVVPEYDAHLEFGPCEFVGPEPTAGDPCLVVFDNERQPWVILPGVPGTGAKGDKGDAGPKGDTGATGPKGDKGDTGTSGASTFVTGTGAPTAGTGVDGAVYLDASNGRMYGPKAAGAWPATAIGILVRDATTYGDLSSGS